MTEYGLKIKLKKRFIYSSCNHKIHQPIFSNDKRNFVTGFGNSTSFGVFLNSIESLSPEYHQSFILACHHYARALREVGADHEMVFIRLVSAIETLSKFIKLSKREDPFQNKRFNDLIKTDKLSRKEIDELKKIFNVRKAKKKFITFVRKYSVGFLKGGKHNKYTKIKKYDLPKILGTIYDARSNYLHNGEPMYLSQTMWGGDKWDMDSSMGKIIDNRRISVSCKLPYTSFFEGLARQCILNFLKDKISENK